jgi:hypothetical protein
LGRRVDKQSNVQVNITVFRSDKTIIFETEPSDALPDVFFENEMSFAITNGNHMGNVQNQNIMVEGFLLLWIPSSLIVLPLVMEPKVIK